MKIIQLLVLCCLLSNTLAAQEKEMKTKYGKVTEEEVKMQYYSKDSSAEAVVLYEQGEIWFDYDNLSGVKIMFSYFGRIKILKKSGLDRGIIKIPLFQGSFDERELLRNLDGCTYNMENGKMVTSKLTKESIFHEHIVDKRYQDKLSFPNLKEGSVFEYRYTKETPFSVNITPDSWFFQGSIPVQWSELNMVIPQNFNYRILKGGYLPFISNTQGTIGIKLGSWETIGTNHHMAVKYAPAFHDEAYVTSKRDYISRIDFELTSIEFPDKSKKNYTDTWDNLSKTLLKSEHYNEAFRRTGFLSSIIQELKGVKDTTEKIKRAFEYVTKNVQWNNKVSVYAHTDAKMVFDNKTGTATEINLILISLLKAIGLEANPVILSTRGNGKINELYPSLEQFNYTIACVSLKGNDILMDASDPFTKPGMLPEHCLSGTGRLIKEEGSRFVSLIPTEKNMRFEMLTASLNTSSGEITGSTVISKGGYEAHEMREAIKEQGESNLLKDFKKANAEWKIENFKLENKDNISESVKLSFDFHFPENVSSGTIYLNPMLSGRVESNPFTEQTRIYPVDLTAASDNAYIATIKIPEGYVVDEIPKPATVALPDNLGKFTYIINTSADAIKISSRITLNEFYFAAEEYEFLRPYRTKAYGTIGTKEKIK